MSSMAEISGHGEQLGAPVARVTEGEVIGEIFITVGVILLLTAAFFLLMDIVFPWVSQLMPYNDVAV